MDRFELFCKLIEAFDIGYNFSFEYDAMPHQFYGETLYQSESHIIQFVGKHPGTTVTMVAESIGKTTSACSQVVKKLCKKGWMQQIRNPANNREYLLELTERGQEVFLKHEKFDNDCYRRNCEQLEQFTDEELYCYIRVQQALNAAFEKDVERSREHLHYEE